jgi:hypothetical protein
MRRAPRESSPLRHRHVFATAGLLPGLTFGLCACDSDDPAAPTPAPPEPGGASPGEVLDLFQEAWRARDIDAYVRILAEDYRFFLDSATRAQTGVTSWDVKGDTAAVARLFASEYVTKIAIELVWPGAPRPSGRVDSPGWVYVDVLDVFLDVDFALTGEDTTKFRVEDQTQRFHFRQGIAPGDTLPESPTSERWFLVEWRDFGTGANRAESDPAPAVSPAVEASSWSSIKLLLRSLVFETRQ